MTELPTTRWSELAGPDPGAAYAARIADTGATGADMHGEATLVLDRLARRGPGPGRVLDAGCGTGRVALRLAELGCPVVGVDADPSMLAQARAAGPAQDWRLADLAAFRPEADEAAYDVVLCAGNVVPLLAPGTLDAVLARLRDALAPAGLLITGFGLDQDHLPDGCPVTPLSAFDTAAAAAGLTLVGRYATWDQQPYDGAGGYAVSVHTA